MRVLAEQTGARLGVRWMPARVTAMGVIALAVVAAACSASGGSPAPAEEAERVIVGEVFRDADNNGQRDAGEVGVPDVVVSSGVEWTLTDADGAYRLPVRRNKVSVRVSTGWFRTQCDSLNCEGRLTTSNNFAVSNQLVKLDDVEVARETRLDVGLIPDWPGVGYPIPPAPIAANSVDVALRVSYIATGTEEGQDCFRTADLLERGCGPGDHPTGIIAILNSGTTELSGVVIEVELPPGLLFESLESSLAPANHPAAGQLEVVTPFDPATGAVRLRLTGVIAPAAAANFDLRMQVADDADGSPEPYALKNPYDRQVFARVVAMDQRGDPDSELCPSWGQCRSNSGIHDKASTNDHMDMAGWNFLGTPVNPVFDLALDLQEVGEPAAAVGDPVTVRATVTNEGTEVARNAEVSLWYPEEITVDGDQNPQWAAKGTRRLQTTWPGQIMPGQSVHVDVVLTAGTVGRGRVVAELTDSTSGRTNAGPEGFLRMFDADSIGDLDRNNDPPDEDDHAEWLFILRSP